MIINIIVTIVLDDNNLEDPKTNICPNRERDLALRLLKNCEERDASFTSKFFIIVVT